MARRRSRGALPYPVELELGPFTRVRDAVDPYDTPRDALAWARNLYPDAPEGGAWRLRPAIQRLTASPLGTSGARTGQAVFQHTGLDGVEYTVAFVGGRFYRFDWSTGAFIDITPAGVSINNATRVYCATFADVMVVHDSANRPWKYNFVTQVASFLTDLAYALHGPWAVYYAKLMAVKASARNTLVWSEELDPDTGYENVLYLNRWVLGQTDQEGLEGIAATNAALYYFRPGSIGIITGAVTEDFQSSGTRDAVSTDVGTLSPGSIMVFDDGIWFADQHLRQYRIAPGDQLDALWTDAWKTYQTAATLDADRVISAPIPGLGIVLTTLPLESQRATGYARPSLMMAFGATGAWYGQWAMGENAEVAVRAMGVVKNLDRQERLMLLGDDGHAYLMDPATASALDDSGTHIMSGAEVTLADEPGIEVSWDTMHIAAREAGGACLLTVTDAQGYEEPALPFALRESTTLALATVARWARARLTSRSTERRFTLRSVRALGRATSDHPEVA